MARLGAVRKPSEETKASERRDVLFPTLPLPLLSPLPSCPPSLLSGSLMLWPLFSCLTSRWHPVTADLVTGSRVRDLARVRGPGPDKGFRVLAGSHPVSAFLADSPVI